MKLENWRTKIESALARGGYTHSYEDLQCMVDRGVLTPFVKGVSVLLVEIADMPSSRILHHFLAAGRIDEIIVLRERALMFGKQYGCTVEMLTGRPGWERVARHLSPGWSEVQIQMSRKIT